MGLSEVDLELISRNEFYVQSICKVLIGTVICDASFKKMSNIGRAQRWVLRFKFIGYLRLSFTVPAYLEAFLAMNSRDK